MIDILGMHLTRSDNGEKVNLKEYWYLDIPIVSFLDSPDAVISYYNNEATVYLEDYSRKEIYPNSNKGWVKLGSWYTLNLTIKKKALRIGLLKDGEYDAVAMVEAIKRLQFWMLEMDKYATLNKSMKEVRKNNFDGLKDKKLLVDPELLSDGFTEEIFGSIYPYAFEFVDEDRIRSSIFSNEKGVAYLTIIQDVYDTFSHQICSSETGEVYAIKLNTKRFRSRELVLSGEEIRVKDLEKLSKH